MLKSVYISFEPFYSLKFAFSDYAGRGAIIPANKIQIFLLLFFSKILRTVGEFTRDKLILEYLRFSPRRRASMVKGFFLWKPQILRLSFFYLNVFTGWLTLWNGLFDIISWRVFFHRLSVSISIEMTKFYEMLFKSCTIYGKKRFIIRLQKPAVYKRNVTPAVNHARNNEISGTLREHNRATFLK